MQKGIKEFQRLFQEEATTILRDATTRAVNSIVRLSPVKSGAFVADWDAAVGAWPADTKPPADPSRSATRKRLKAVINNAQYGQALFLENSDPVSVRIEYGYSEKAPQGVVRLTCRRWRSFVRGAGIAAQNRVGKRIIEG